MKEKIRANRSGRFESWMILGVLLLIAMAFAAVVFLSRSGADQGSDAPNASVLTSNQDGSTGESVSKNPLGFTEETGDSDSSGESTDHNQGNLNDSSVEQQATEATRPVYTRPIPPEQQLICEDYAIYNGAFVEDGTDEPVENVAALLITNNSDQYLDLGKLTYELDGHEAVFMVTGLPAGDSAWVLENSRMQASAETQFSHRDTLTSFRDDASRMVEGLNLECSDGALRAINTTDRTLKAVTVYYKVLHDDGNYLGGITYMTTFGDLEPGQSSEKIAGHFQPDKARIVRVGYLES